MKKKRKALLLSAGYGRGHHSAARALAEELQHRGWQTALTDACAEARPRLFRATQLFYEFCVRHAPWLWDIAYEQIGRTDCSKLVHAPGFAACMDALRRKIQKEKPRLIVCTYPLYAHMLDALFNEGLRRVPYAVVVTDALSISPPWLSTQAPLICLPDEHSHALVQTRYALPPARLAAPGFPVRKAFLADGLRPTPGPGGEGLHVVYGAYAPLRRVKADVEALLHTWPNMRLSLLAVERGDKLHAALQERPNVTICGSEQDPAPLLRSAHFYIGKAGAATLFEAYAAETPVIINYALPGQEQGNLQLLELDGAGRYAESSAELLRLLKHMLANGAAGWQNMRLSMRRARRNNGASCIADLLEGRLLK